MTLIGEVTQKSLHLSDPHILGMALPMEQNKTPHPIGINFFSADTVMHRPDAGAQLIQKLGRVAGIWSGVFHLGNFRLLNYCAMGNVMNIQHVDYY